MFKSVPHPIRLSVLYCLAKPLGTIYIYIYIFTHTHIHYTYIDGCMHTYIHRWMHTYIHTHTHTHIHTYIHTYIQININIHHTHTHTHAHTRVHYCLFSEFPVCMRHKEHSFTRVSQRFEPREGTPPTPRLRVSCGHGTRSARAWVDKGENRNNTCAYNSCVYHTQTLIPCSTYT